MFSNYMTNTTHPRTIDENKKSMYSVKPRVDILESDSNVTVMLEMPGVNKEDLTLKIENGLLHISGKRSQSAANGEFILRETREVLYERIFELEKSLDADSVNAKYRAGILSVTIAKKEKAQPRVIEIN